MVYHLSILCPYPSHMICYLQARTLSNGLRHSRKKRDTYRHLGVNSHTGGVGVPGVAEESRSLVSGHRLGRERLFVPSSHSVLDVVLRELGLLHRSSTGVGARQVAALQTRSSYKYTETSQERREYKYIEET